MNTWEKENNVGKVLRWCWPPMLAAGILVFALQGTHWAQGKMGMGTAQSRAVDKIIYNVLRDVANRGADLFNKQNDWPGCYRVYEGGLLTVKPFLAHRPDLQKAIDDGMQDAEQQGRAIDRAFALRKVIDQIREDLKGAPAAKDKATTKDKGTMKASTDKVTKDKATKDKDKEEEKKTPVGSGNLSGKVTLDGKAGALGYVTLISATEKRSYSTAIAADGAYAFRTPIPAGSYVVILEDAPREKGKLAPSAIPERYRSPATSGLSVEVRRGPMEFDVQLKR